MRRVAAVAVIVTALVGAVGAETLIKARNGANLPKATITVEEVGIETVTVEVKADTQPMSGRTYAAN